MRIIPLFILNLFVFNSFAGSQDIIESSIRFDIKNAGITVEGNFSGLEGSIHFDPADYTKSHVDLSIASNSIQTGINSRDNHLRKAEYFDVEHFPSIRLKSRFFGKATEENAFRGYFTLTLKGISKDITLPFTCIKEGDKYRIRGSFNLNRRDYGVGNKSLIMGDEVTIHINILVSSEAKSKKQGSQFPKQTESMPRNNLLYWIYIKP